MRPTDSLCSFPTHFHNTWRLGECISPSRCHIWKSPNINKTHKKRGKAVFIVPHPSIGENKRCFKSARYSPSRTPDLWRRQWRVKQPHGCTARDLWVATGSRGLTSQLPRTCIASAFFPQPNIYQLNTRETLTRPAGPRLCVYGREGRTSPIKHKPPRYVDDPPLCRGWKDHVHIYLNHGRVSLHFPLAWWFFVGFFYSHWGGSPQWVSTQTQLQSAPRCYLLSPSPNETNRTAVSEMHYWPAYRHALQWIMVNFYSQLHCDTELFLADETKPSVYTRRAAVRDDPQRKITDFRLFFKK